MAFNGYVISISETRLLRFAFEIYFIQLQKRKEEWKQDVFVKWHVHSSHKAKAKVTRWWTAKVPLKVLEPRTVCASYEHYTLSRSKVTKFPRIRLLKQTDRMSLTNMFRALRLGGLSLWQSEIPQLPLYRTFKKHIYEHILLVWKFKWTCALHFEGNVPSLGYIRRLQKQNNDNNE